MSEFIQQSKSRALRINSIIRKELEALRHDKIAIFILFFIPIILIGVLGTSQPRSDLMDVKVWVIDEDNSQKSNELIQTMKAGMIKPNVTGEVIGIERDFGEGIIMYDVNITNAIELLPTTYLDAYIIIPKGFEAAIKTNSSATLIWHFDAIDFTKKLIVELGMLTSLVQFQLNNMVFERDVFYFPEVRPEDAIGAGIGDIDMSGGDLGGGLEGMNIDNATVLQLSAPIFVSLMLYVCINLVTTQAIVGDKPLKRLLTTPLYRSEVIIAKILAYTILSIIQIIITLLLLQYFGVKFRCLWIDIFVLLLLNSISAICLGVFFSTISKSRLQASQLFLLAFFVMVVLQSYVRNPVFLKFIALEQCASAFSDLAMRGSSLINVLDNIGGLILQIVFLFTLTTVYIKYIKKDFV